jgi:Leucine-rich repeat (LRR) protein
VDSATGVLSRTGGSLCGDPGCKFLSLSGLSFSSIAPGTFDGMSHLVVLDLSNNQLANITHDDFKDLTALEELVLSRNRLTSIAPGTFAGLHALQNVSLYNNKLASIEAGTFAGSDGLSAMETFDLSNNELGFISEGGFEGLSNVRTLKLNYNGAFDSYNYNWLLRIEDGAFRHMPLLGFLDLSNSGVRNITDGTFSGGLVHLETIYMYSTNRWGGAGLRLAPGAFGELPGLKTLNLNDNELPQEDFEPGLFRNCSNLTGLNLHDNRLTTLSAETFAGLGDSLEWLDVSNNDITSVSVGAFSGFRKLRYLSLWYNDLTTLPLEVFGDMGSEYRPSMGYASVDLYGNPLVCIPRAPTNGGLSGTSADTLPQCPSEVQLPLIFFTTPRKLHPPANLALMMLLRFTLASSPSLKRV